MKDLEEFTDREYFKLYMNLITAEPAPDPAEMLYHYTSSRGLLGILEEGRLWATNLEFLNDPSELKHTIALAERLTYAQVIVLSRKEPLFSDLLGKVFHSIDSYANSYRFFTTCFCQDGGDTLSQWRAYGDMGTGYSLGFSLQDLEKGLARYTIKEHRTSAQLVKEHHTGAQLVKVVYSEEEQNGRIANLLSELLNTLSRIVKETSEAEARDQFPWMRDLFLLNLFKCLFSFKNRGYSEEKEWRIVMWGRTEDGNGDSSETLPKTIHFRPSKHFVIPYTRLNLSHPDVQPERLPVAEIVQGPRLQPEVGAKGLSMLKSEWEYDAVHIRKSEIPLR